MDEVSDLAEKALNGKKNCNFIQNEKQLQNLFCEINHDIKFSKTTFYSWEILNYPQKPLMTTS